MRNNGYELVDLEVSIGGDDDVPDLTGSDDIIPEPQQAGVCFDRNGNELMATISGSGILEGTNEDDVIVGSDGFDEIYTGEGMI